MMNITKRVRKLLLLLFCVHTGAPIALAQSHQEQDTHEVALGLGGGGFLSVTEMAGITSGLLSVLMKYSDNLVDSDNALAESGLFSRVASINSISGGSWFASRLAYSKEFRITIEKVAKQQVKSSAKNGTTNRKETIKEVAKAYNDRDFYLEKIDAGKKTPLGGKLTGIAVVLAKIQAIVNKTPLEVPEATRQTIGLVGTLLDKGLLSNLKLFPIQWIDVCSEVVLGDIPNMTFGSPVQDWSIGKKWRVIVTAVTPNATEPNLIFNGSELNYLKYNVSPKPPSKFIPVRFSAVLGYPDEPIPDGSVDAYDTSGLLRTYKVEYKGKDFPLGSLLEKKWAQSPQGINATLNSHQNFKDMPLIGPVSASSGFLGGKTFDQTISAVLADIQVDPSVYYAPRLTGKDAFDKPQSIMRNVWQKKDPDREKANELAKIGAYGITDGGQLDNFAIATAVATGVEHIFIVDVASVAGVSWKTHFRGAEAVAPANFTKDFPYEIWNIFSENQYYADKQEKLKLRHLKVAKDTELLKGIRYGTITATTRKQKYNYFGIKGGRKVHITLFQIDVCNLFKKDRFGKSCTDKRPVSIGINQNFKDYGLLIAEVMDTLNDYKNKRYVYDMIRRLGGKIQSYGEDDRTEEL